MNWSVRQQAMLEAMGLQVMVRVASGAPAAAMAPLPAPSNPAPPARSAASEGRPASEHVELARALSRAAGGRDLAGLVDDLARLRREPALKRALWPRLRTLLRSH